jgi:hypothetical protein
MSDSNKLASFIKDSGLSYKQNNKSFIFTCPLCHTKEKLYIRKEDGKFACWKCRETQGFQGAPEYALHELTGQPLKAIKKALYGLTDSSGAYINIKYNDFIDENDKIIEEIENDIPNLTIPYHCLDITHPGAVNGANYLLKRGIHLEIASKYHIKYSPIKQAIMFPAYVDKNLVGWQYRTTENLKIVLDDDSIITRLKSLNSKDYPKDRIFLFQDNLINSDYAVLCEGPIDAIKAGSRGICALGKSISQKQVNILLRSGLKKLYIALDPDAFMELEPLIDKFDNTVELLKVNIPNKGKKPDIGELTFEEAQECIKNAEPIRKNKIYLWFKSI